MKPIEFDPNVSNDLLENIDEQLGRGEIVTFESCHRRKDGSEFPVEVRVRPFWHGGRRLNISVVRDISDRKRAEQAVRRSERELRELIETIPAMAFVIGRDGSSEFVSRQWIEFSGMSAERNTGENWAATLHPEDREDHIAKWRAAHASGQPFENEARRQTRHEALFFSSSCLASQPDWRAPWSGLTARAVTSVQPWLAFWLFVRCAFLTSDQVNRIRSSSSAVTGLAAVQVARRYQAVLLPHRRQARKQATHPEGRELPGE
jgi:PAS domain S-box-containing protein